MDDLDDIKNEEVTCLYILLLIRMSANSVEVKRC